MSKIEVNTIDVACGSTITLGSSGKTVQIACGASTVGMGRTGTVDWCSTIYTNSPGTVTGVNGKGYFLNTTSGVITVNLPSSPSAGDIIAFKDYAGTFSSNKVNIGRNGSKINGVCDDATLITDNQSVTLIYVDSTKGWQDIHDSTSNVSGNPGFMVAAGGTETTSGDYKIHTFNSDANFVVSSVGDTPVGQQVSYMVVAGGASGGYSTGNSAGGGGAGGFREGKVSTDPYTDSPLDAGSGLTLTTQTYPVTVGGGGAVPACNSNDGTAGSTSTFSTITSAGGGGGGRHVEVGLAGGSGGGGGGGNSTGKAGGSGNTPPVSPPQGQNGGTGGSPSPDQMAGGGGGATATGTNASNPTSGAGGAGATTSITASPVARAGGGGGGGVPGAGSPGAGGTGGGGSGGCNSNGNDATANTGGGGGGGSNHNRGGQGGSGVVVIRYKFQ
tara:strand:+ start:26 stop:1354 length:1329 start_codon:yes stop_codon:yes gene_type:complete